MTELESFIAEQKNKTLSVAVYDFQKGEEILINPDEAYHPASTIKIHVMMEVFHQARQCRLALEDCIPITNSFTSIADGSKFSLDMNDDAEQTLYPRLGNLATNILLETVVPKSVSDFITALGIQGVKFIRGIEDNAAFRLGMNNSATARGLTQTMKLIAEKKVVSEQTSEKMIEILLAQEFNESIPALLPETVKVAHKTGWTGDVYHDTGIVYPEGRPPYVISIMTRGFAEDKEQEAHACMATLSKWIYEKLH
jgi:beta-lactamase class A